MERIFISIGSNLGDRVENCLKAIGELKGSRWASVVRESSMYEAEPWGTTDQPPFINCAVEMTTTLNPSALLGFLMEIELGMGRVKGDEKERWAPRLIDLDIIFFGDRIVEEEGLAIPHPLAVERAFVLVPLAEIAPEMIHPALKKSVSELAGAVPGRDGVRRIKENRKAK
jgi:2-amino-4-hydroxy-6-hydroxymethyldihydropteridine diphosphokinase